MKQLWRSEAAAAGGSGGVDMNRKQAQLGFVRREQNMNKTESPCGYGFGRLEMDTNSEEED
ncbi:hypothetical protein VP1G_11110 [Cytospora mali]|uniref:Uncharacterized protein n=1 Tax=Cytospora mali TaxID=578113 RepID=A0A194V4D8_CYTMA|nr:hypothetical protein VP1G_11110 [Valsa mali var. pyri (nom. inval.)]